MTEDAKGRRWSIARVSLMGGLSIGACQPIVERTIPVQPEPTETVESPPASPPDVAAPIEDAPVDPPAAPTIDAPEQLVLDEQQSLSLRIGVQPSSEHVRLLAQGLPPGARWDEAARTLHYRPDFISGGPQAVWSVVLTAAAPGYEPVEHTLRIEVRDTVQPPWPTVDRTERWSGFTRLHLSQHTDDFLDAPERAGRSIAATVTRPEGPSTASYPVVVLLHGFLEGPRRGASRDRFIISPHDPDNTYWWGYRTEDEHGARVPPYTQRRVLHLLEWVLRHEPTADPERVFIAGRSMGGAGAATLGLMRARHFAGIDAWYGQAIPRNHRPSRIAQLSTHWGAPSAGLGAAPDDALSVWDAMDLTRVLLEHPEARHQWWFSKHSKDDPVIHFGAAVLPSERTNLSLYDALARTGTGHFVVWDEGGHGDDDPLLGGDWWGTGWDPVDDPITFLRRDRALIGFSAAAHDDEPGDGSNGRRSWHDEMGYAGAVDTAGDTGWNGDRFGTRNRHLRWDTRAIEDTPERFSGPVRVDPGHAGPWPVRADVSLRRVQAFHCRAGEAVDWSLGDHSGQVVADERGGVTIRDVPLTDDWETLEVTRLDG